MDAQITQIRASVSHPGRQVTISNKTCVTANIARRLRSSHPIAADPSGVTPVFMMNAQHPASLTPTRSRRYADSAEPRELRKSSGKSPHR